MRTLYHDHMPSASTIRASATETGTHTNSLTFETTTGAISLVDVVHADYPIVRLMLAQLALDGTRGDICIVISNPDGENLATNERVPHDVRHHDIDCILSGNLSSPPFRVDNRHATTLSYFMASAAPCRTVERIVLPDESYIGYRNEGFDETLAQLLHSHGTARIPSVRYDGLSAHTHRFQTHAQTASYQDVEINATYTFKPGFVSSTDSLTENSKEVFDA